MSLESWPALSVLYICPLRALLNNLEPRLAGYCDWLGRRAAVWHGDVSFGRRRQLIVDRPDVLLTTPESLEAMLVSATFSAHEVFADLRAVVVDEVHAFAGDDRGWHLLAVLERLTRLAGRPLQRIGLSATVGNPRELLGWLQGSGRGVRRATVLDPDVGTATSADVQLDFVGNVENAATVIAALHQGEKRLVFAESRRRAEALAIALHERDVTTFVSHSSLSAEERRRAEKAFAEARNCVIVATSTLELGVDVGDLDRVIQLGAPRTVASLLQRLGRTGRRAGGERNMLLLATSDDELMHAAGLLLLWSGGYVEPVAPPPSPRHLQAQQLLALCLQEGRVGQWTWAEWLDGLQLASPDESVEIASWLVATGHLDRDSGMLFIGPSAERNYGRRHFLDLVSVFTAAPEFTVLHGSSQVGTIDQSVLIRRVDGPRVFALAGRSWQVVHIDWQRTRLWVQEADVRGTSRWTGVAQPWSFELTDAVRRVLLGDDPSDARMTRRATTRLAELRAERSSTVDRDRTVVADHAPAGSRWWTWAGGRANTVLASALGVVAPGLIDDHDRFDNRYLKLAQGRDPGEIAGALRACVERFGSELAGVQIELDDEALDALKFAELLPPAMAIRTLASRYLDQVGAARVAAEGVVVRHQL
jgi:ATP-dependent Lhr-like helicase